jgi:hypothetical protein
VVAELPKVSPESRVNTVHAKGAECSPPSLPDGKKALPCRWVYKVERDKQGRVDEYKSRIVAKEFLQRGEQFSSDKLYASPSNISTLRVLLSLAAQEDLEVHQLDVQTASLNGDLTEELYMKCPPGFEVQGMVWKL